MKAQVRLENLKTEKGKKTIIRNLSRIMDIHIENIDIRKHVMSFFYSSPATFQKVKMELSRIGYPIRYIMRSISDGSSFGDSFTEKT